MTDIGYLLILAHLLGASVWVGGHLVLALRILPAALRTGDVAAIRSFEAAFERIGLPAFAIQVVTGFWLALRLNPDWTAWADLGDPLSRAIALKLGCLAASLGLALHARLWLIPTLSARTLPSLGWHIRAITLVAVVFVIAGASVRVGGLAP
jgi:putative copper export protein